jgi:hypothetical protein
MLKEETYGGISHKQAVQWIHRCLDELLNEDQFSRWRNTCNPANFAVPTLPNWTPPAVAGKFHALG